MIHIVKGFGIVNKAEVDVFLKLSCFFYDPTDFGNLISGSSAFSKSSLENFEHYFASVWDECNCAVVWTFFGIAFHWDWNENWSFPVLWTLLYQVLIATCGIFSCSVWTLSCGTQTLSCSMWDLVPWPRIKPGPLHFRECSLSHRTAREVPTSLLTISNYWCYSDGWQS